MDLYLDQKLLEPPTKGNVPAFLTKLWRIVEDEQYDHLVTWNEDGTAIKIHQPVAFSQEILPKFYKHNNFSSFVRQVNMYGFRKNVDVTASARPGDGDWEFHHPYFQRGHPENIALMKRKGQLKEEIKPTNLQFANLLQDVEKLKNQHVMVEDKLNHVKSENERLWREVFDLRERHSSQQSMIVKLIQFFLQIVMNKPDRPRKRRYPDEKDITEKVFFQKRAIRLHDDNNKKMQIQRYDSSPASSLTELIKNEPFRTPTEASTSLSNDRLTELSPRETVNAVKEDNTYISEAPINVKAHSLGGPSGSLGNSSLRSPFIFPEIYRPESDVIDLSSCISNDDSTPLAVPSEKMSSSDFSTLVKKLVKTSQPLSTPVVSMPSVITRQKSFRDREEISTNVDKIEKNIETLQEMLNKQGINVDLKNINSLYSSDVPSNTGMQDLLKLLQQQNEEVYPNEENEVIQFEDGGTAAPECQVIPYTSFSPSHLMNPEFGALTNEDIQTDLFESVLSEEEDDDGNVRVKIPP